MKTVGKKSMDEIMRGFTEIGPKYDEPPAGALTAKQVAAAWNVSVGTATIRLHRLEKEGKVRVYAGRGVRDGARIGPCAYYELVLRGGEK